MFHVKWGELSLSGGLKGKRPWKVQTEFPKNRGYTLPAKPRLQEQQGTAKSDELENLQ